MVEEEYRRRLATFTATLAERLRACHTVPELCRMVGGLCHELQPDDVVIVSLYDHDDDVVTIREYFGVGNTVDRLLELLGTDPRKMGIRPQDMEQADKVRYCSGRMEVVPGGVYELLTRRVPRPVCVAAQRLLGVHDIYVVGFALEDVPRGGLTILRRHPSPPEDQPLIELMSGMVSLAIRQAEAEHRRMELERQLQQAQRLESIGKLAGGVAHDYNNTLQAVGILAELVQCDLPDDHPVQENMRDLIGAVEHAKETTRSLLAIGRRQRLNLAPLDLVGLIVDVERLLQRTLRDDIEIRCEVEEEGIVIRGDGSEIRRCLINLAINAQDAMPTGGRLSLRAHIDTSRSLAIVEVQDNGCGMSPEVRERVFDPFFTTKPVDQGTGLGLAAVYGIVKQHDGQIDLVSTPGAGSRFTLSFPLIDKGVEKKTTLESARPLRASAPEGWILVVDDEPMVLRLVCRYLRRIEWDVEGVSSPAEALSACSGRRTAPRLVLTDVTMPGMSGRELVRRLRDLYPGLPAILMSGYDTELASAAKPSEHVWFLPKPFTIKSLEDVLSEARVREG